MQTAWRLFIGSVTIGTFMLIAMVVLCLVAPTSKHIPNLEQLILLTFYFAIGVGLGRWLVKREITK